MSIKDLSKLSDSEILLGIVVPSNTYSLPHKRDKDPEGYYVVIQTSLVKIHVSAGICFDFKHSTPTDKCLPFEQYSNISISLFEPNSSKPFIPYMKEVCNKQAWSKLFTNHNGIRLSTNEVCNIIRYFCKIDNQKAFI